ncbi:MAG: hypothetical protein SPL94_06995 [Oribacterium sp.]|nr:hypothetical protein [Oribacterium sp.]
MENYAEEMTMRGLAAGARIRAARRCLMEMEKIFDDFEDMVHALCEPPRYTDEAACIVPGRLQEKITEKDSIGAAVVFPTGRFLKYPLSSLEREEWFEDEIIESLGDTGFLFSYAAQDVVIVSGNKYLDGAMVIFKTDPEGELIPLDEDDLEKARDAACRMLKIFILNEERSIVFALEQEAV